MEIIKCEKGALTILSGKTDMGKSTLSVYNAAQQIREGAKVMFISYEYCQSIIYNKLVEHFGLRWQELFGLDVCSGTYMPLKAIEEMLEVKKEAVEVMYVDYLDLLKNVTYPKDKEDKAQSLEDNKALVSALASMAKKYNISIVLLAQQESGLELDQIVAYLNDLTASVKKEDHVIKMFIEKDDVLGSRIQSGDMSHVIWVDGYDLKHFASFNIKEAYKK